MEGMRRLKNPLRFGLAAMGIVAIAGCAARKPSWVDSKDGVSLRYKTPPKQALRYVNANEMVQTTKFGERAMVTRMNSRNILTVRPAGGPAEPIRMDFTLDSLRIDIQSPAGNMSPDLSGLVGRGFAMTLTSLGRETDVSGAAELKYTLGQMGERNLETEFKTFFDDLPADPVSPGAAWTSRDTIKADQPGTDIRLVFENVNTYDGVETVSGLPCVRIKTVSKGSMKGSGDSGGAKFEMDGTITGTGTWYFAPREGVLVKSASDVTTESTIRINAPQEMSLPMTMVMKGEKSLRR
jgi:hypothetical protein